MMTGIVTADREGVLRIIVYDASGQPHEFDAVIDTGYTATLTLPSAVVATLGLTWRDYGRGILADGSQSNYSIYEGVVIWDNRPRLTLIHAMGDVPLIGMTLMYGYHLDMPIVDGGTFTLRRLPVP